MYHVSCKAFQINSNANEKKKKKMKSTAIDFAMKCNIFFLNNFFLFSRFSGPPEQIKQLNINNAKTVERTEKLNRLHSK